MKALKDNRILLAQLDIQEKIRTDLVEDLHGNISQLLGSSKMLIGLAERSAAKQPEALQTAHSILAQAMHALRILCRPLDRNWQEQFSLIPMLEGEILRINHLHAGNSVSFQYSGVPVNMSIPAQIVVFGMVRDLLRVAPEQTADESCGVLLLSRPGRLKIRVRYRRRNPQEEAWPEGQTMRRIRHFAALLDAELQCIPPKEINLTIPINHSPDASDHHYCHCR